MDNPRRTPIAARTPDDDATLVAELKSSALLFGMAIGATAGAVSLSQLAIRVLN